MAYNNQAEKDLSFTSSLIQIVSTLKLQLLI